MRRGTRVWQGSLEAARRRCAAQRSALPERHRALDAEPYEPERSRALVELTDAAADAARRRHGLAPGPAASLP
jgi:hypothetical protein